MATSGPRRPGRLEASFDTDVWSQEVERLREGKPMRAAAERARNGIAANGGFVFVFELAEARGGGVTLRFLAFGERHPAPGTRSVYERAHKRLHGRYPEE